MAEHFEAAAHQDVPKSLSSLDFIGSTVGGANSGGDKLSGLVKDGLSGADKLVNSSFGNLTLVDGRAGHSAVPTDDAGREIMAKKVPPELDPRNGPIPPRSEPIPTGGPMPRPPEHIPTGGPMPRPPEQIPPDGPIHRPTESPSIRYGF